MPRFFCKDENITDTQIILDGEDAKHLSKVLRVKIAEKITVSDLSGYDYFCEVSQVDDKQVYLDIIEKKINESEPHTKVTLYQAMPKGDKLDLIVQKAVELGVHKVVLVLTKRCVSRPDEKSARKKVERLQKIAKEAAKQSGRGIIPTVEGIVSYNEALKLMSKHQKSLLFYEAGGERINEILSGDETDIGFMVGSEGGFDVSEVECDAIKENGVELATLGKLILRCETAPMCALSIVMNVTHNI